MNKDFKRVRPDEMDSVIALAYKDHPKVRRIEGDTYGVTCGDQERCSKKTEHVIRFLANPRGLYARCEDCVTNEYHIPYCRHIAAALPLCIYYHEAEKAVETIPCPNCQGSGWIGRGIRRRSCDDCMGDGQSVRVTANTSAMMRKATMVRSSDKGITLRGIRI